MKRSKITSVLTILLCAVFLVSCAPSMIDYYADKDHYITATGVVSHIQLDEEGLYIGLTKMDYPFDDDTFKIVGENLKIVQQKGLTTSSKRAIPLRSSPLPSISAMAT